MSQEEQIRKLAEKLNMKAFVRRELRQLPDMLYEGEEVLNLTQGEYEGNQGLIAVTDRRIMFIDEGIVRNRREDFPYERISSVQCSKSIMSGTLTIFASGSKAVIKKVVPRQQAEAVAETVRALIAPDAKPAAEPSAPAAAPAADDPYEKLRKLGELRDAGVLTADEFEEQKRSILSRL